MTTQDEYLTFFESLWREFDGDEAAMRRRLREWADARGFVFYDMGLAEYYEEPEPAEDNEDEPAQPPDTTRTEYRYRHYDQHVGLLRDYISLESARSWYEAVKDDPALPAQRLVRTGHREKERDWNARWRAAYDSLPPEQQARACADQPAAMLDCDIWRALSVFDLPYPPFDYDSGMDVAPVNADEAAALGLPVGTRSDGTAIDYSRYLKGDLTPEDQAEIDAWIEEVESTIDLPFEITVEIEQPR